VSPDVFTVRTVELDLPALAGAFARRLRDAGVPVTPERAARFAQALTIVRPVARRRLYWTARATLVSDATQVRAFDAVFASVFGMRAADGAVDLEDARSVPVPSDERRPADERRTVTHPPDAHPLTGGAATRPREGDGDADDLHEVAVPVAASDEERLRSTRFCTT
jgi:uncharacterized protein